MATRTKKSNKKPTKPHGPKPERGKSEHSTGDIVHLQQALGNRAFSQLLKDQSNSAAGSRASSNRSDRDQPLDPRVRQELMSKLGHDIPNVRVQTGPKAARSAESLDAAAYTTRDRIVFGEGQYQPGTEAGRKLLLHEAAHAVHQNLEGSLNPGVAPTDSLAERKADLIPDAQSASGKMDFRDWGPAWQVHRQKVTKKGTAVHTGEVGAPAAGMSGPAIGSVEVRTGDELEMPDKSKIANLISIEYAGAFPADSKWLQFVWFELTAATPKGTARVAGSVPTTSGTKPFTTTPASPTWSVDSGSTTDPFYETAGVAIRSASGTTIFDRPGGASATSLADAVFKSGVGATSVTFAAHFDTYLIQKGAAAYHVDWAGTTTFTPGKGGGATTASLVGYAVGAGGAVSAVPANLKKVLDTSYPAFKSKVK